MNKSLTKPETEILEALHSILEAVALFYANDQTKTCLDTIAISIGFLLGTKQLLEKQGNSFSKEQEKEFRAKIQEIKEKYIKLQLKEM